MTLRILWVTQEPPDASLGGGNIRQAAMVRALSRWADVHLMMIGPLRDERVREAVSELTELPDPGMPRPHTRVGARLLSVGLLIRREPREVFLGRRAGRVLGPALGASADRYDVVIVNHQALIPLLPRTRRATWVIHLHNVSAERTRQRQATHPGRRQRWLFAREAAMEEELERRAVTEYDGVMVVSAEDATLLARDASEVPVWVVPNGVDAERYAPAPLPSEPRVLLSASLNYPPNADGATWFAETVFPLVRARVPDVRFDIVGREPGASVLALAAEDGVAVHGDVPDMLPWLQGCRVAVVPLRQGTGTRLKALEALAAGRPLVGTAIGLEGLGLVDGTHAAIADDPEAMAAAIVALLTDDGLAARRASAGRALVEERYRWEMIAAQFAADLAAFTGVALDRDL